MEEEEEEDGDDEEEWNAPSNGIMNQAKEQPAANLEGLRQKGYMRKRWWMAMDGLGGRWVLNYQSETVVSPLCLESFCPRLRCLYFLLCSLHVVAYYCVYFFYSYL